MARFYFHLRRGPRVQPDTDGAELPDVAAVEYEAREAALGLIADDVLEGRKPALDRTFDVMDESGRVVLRFPFRHALNDNPSFF